MFENYLLVPEAIAAVANGSQGFRTAPVTAEEVAPILEVLPLQSLALGLSLARGGDPDNPRGLSKVTRTL